MKSATNVQLSYKEALKLKDSKLDPRIKRDLEEALLFAANHINGWSNRPNYWEAMDPIAEENIQIVFHNDQERRDRGKQVVECKLTFE